MTTQDNKIAKAIETTLISPNEVDRNLEAANVVDALFAIARAIQYRLTTFGNSDATPSRGELETVAKALLDGSEKISGALNEVASALRERKEEL